MLLLCCAALLTACDTLKGNEILDEEIMKVRPYPEEPSGEYKQDAVAVYLVKAKAAYLSCVATLESRKAK